VEQEFQETTRCAEADYVQFGCWVWTVWKMWRG
jgi:hypothetical protein